MPPRPTEHRQAGFTLVETLVCLALASLIGTLFVGAFRTAGFAAGAASRVAAADDLQVVREHLRRTLGSLARRNVDGSRPALAGAPTELVAVIGPDRAAERAGDLRVVLAAIPRADGTMALVETRSAYGATPDGRSTQQAETLVDGALSIGMRYFGRPGRDKASAWSRAWTRPDDTPGLVEISVEFGRGDTRRWAPLLVALGDRP